MFRLEDQGDNEEMERGLSLFERAIMQNDFKGAWKAVPVGLTNRDWIDFPLEVAEWQAITIDCAARLQPIPTNTRALQIAQQLRSFMAKTPKVPPASPIIALENILKLEKAFFEVCEKAISFILLARSSDNLWNIKVPAPDTAYNEKQHIAYAVEGDAVTVEDASGSTIVCAMSPTLTQCSIFHGKRVIVEKARVVVR